MIIDAKFHELQAVGPAIVSLKRYGLCGDQIEVYSGKPLELGLGVLDRPSPFLCPLQPRPGIQSGALRLPRERFESIVTLMAWAVPEVVVT